MNRERDRREEYYGNSSGGGYYRKQTQGTNRKTTSRGTRDWETEDWDSEISDSSSNRPRVRDEGDGRRHESSFDRPSNRRSSNDDAVPSTSQSARNQFQISRPHSSHQPPRNVSDNLSQRPSSSSATRSSNCNSFENRNFTRTTSGAYSSNQNSPHRRRSDSIESQSSQERPSRRSSHNTEPHDKPKKRKPSSDKETPIIPPIQIKKEKPDKNKQPSSFPKNHVLEAMLPDLGCVKFEPIQPNRNSLPMPKKACVPHYCSHDANEELEYIKPPFQPIPDHKSDESTDDESVGISATEKFIRGKNGIRFKTKDVFKQYNFKKWKYEEETRRLAVYKNKAEILKLVEENRVVVIEGYTGCGKTTQIPQFILDSFAEKNKPCNIAVTQPRRIAATTVAKRVADERCWEVGDVVGYQVGKESRKSRRGVTMLTYMTTGVLSEKLIQRKSLREWTHIIIDEVHERDIETDLLLLVIKKILMDNKDGKEQRVKIILMSATLEAEKFSNYFPIGNDNKWNLAPIFKINKNSASHKLETVYIEKFINPEESDKVALYEEFQLDNPQIIEDMYELAADIVDKLDEMEQTQGNDPKYKGAALVFLPGRQEIKELHQLLEQRNITRVQRNRNAGKANGEWTILDLHSGISWEDQQLVFQKPLEYDRKLILSTNVAESSITVPDVVYVIDFCLTKRMAIDNTTNFGCLTLTWASRSQCIQRAGRAGRVRNGTVFRLIPQGFFGDLGSEPPPEMKECGLESVILRIKAIELGSPKEMMSLAIDPPVLSSIERAVVNLKEAGALTIMKTVPCTTNPSRKVQSYDRADGDLTFIGRVMAKLPIDPQCARLIIFGYVFGVLNESIIIAASLSGKRPFNSKRSDLGTYEAKVSIANKTQSDLIAFLYLYNEWIAEFDSVWMLLQGQQQIQNFYRKQREWARNKNVDISVLKDIKANVIDIKKRLGDTDMNLEDVGVLEDETPQMRPGYALPIKRYSKQQLLMIKIAIAGAFYPNYFFRDKPQSNNDISFDNECSRTLHSLDIFNTIYFKGFPRHRKGDIYAATIADQLSFGELPPRITFKDSLVLVTFDPILHRNGPFNNFIYKAIKKRQLRQNIKFSLLREEEERGYEERCKKQKAIENRGIPCPPQVDLPGLDVQEVYVVIQYVVNPSKFYITYSCHNDNLTSIWDTISKFMANATELHEEVDIVPGNLCLALFQGHYYRAEMLSRPNHIGQLFVFFIDYGNTELVDYKTLRKLSKEHTDNNLHSIPAMAVECRLSELKYSSLHDIFWDASTISRFENRVKELTNLRIKIFSVVKSVINGELIGHEIKDGLLQLVNINDYLKNENLAIKVPESWESKANNTFRQNHEYNVRERVQVNSSEVNSHNQNQIATIPRYIDYLDPLVNSNKKLHNPAELKGPWTPLEIHFKSLCQSSLQKDVQIDSTSVNSVSLDPQPSAPTSRLIVAASVSISDNKTKVVARETTIMPPIPGLLGFVTMIFAPKVELRVDRWFENYTGLICGLGTEPESGNPIYLDHDMEVPFDCVVSQEDLDTVNRIRYAMNLILHQRILTDRKYNPKEYHEYIIDNLTWLLTQDRKPLDTHTDSGFNWNKIHPNKIEPPPADLPSDPEQIFQYHSSVKLCQKRSNYKKYDGII